MKEAGEIMKQHRALLEAAPFAFSGNGPVAVSNEQGVYIVYSSSDELLHVGKTNRGKEGISQRLQNHVRNQSSFSRQYLKPRNINLQDGYKFKYLEIENGRKRTLVEALTTGLLCPAHIGTGEKRKSIP